MPEPNRDPAAAGPATPHAPRLFYGWVVVGAAFCITFLGFGSVYSFGVFVGALQHDFTASRASVSLVFSLAGFFYMLLGAVSGPAADRWGVRRLAISGMILAGAGMVCAGMAHTLLQVYLAFGVGMGLGLGAAYVPVLSTVQRWFNRRRGLASGLAVSGIGIGTLVMPQLAALLIESAGWRTAYLTLGGLTLVGGAAAATLIERDPAARGLSPDGEAVPAQGPAEPTGASLAEALRSRVFYRLYAACMIGSFGVSVPFVHLVPYAIDHGVAQGRAGMLVSMIGIGSTAGRFALGSVADRIGRRQTLVVMFIGMGLMLCLWPLAIAFWPLAAFAFGYGVFYGGWVAVLPTVVMDYFGGRKLSSIIGVLYTSTAFGNLAGPIAAGLIFDLRQTYTLPILGCGGGDLFAGPIVAAAATLPVWGGGQKRQ
ncbi:MAG: MFS transporter [Reyranella sp.]|nr:MFS transporter [Reyranella sp.]